MRTFYVLGVNCTADLLIVLSV